MRSPEKMLKVLLLLLFMAVPLVYGIQEAFALDEADVRQLNNEIVEVAKQDPELAKAVRDELREAIASGEVEIPEAEGADRSQHPETGADPEKIRQGFEGLVNDLIKSGMSPEEAEKKAGQAMHEKYGGPEAGDFVRPDFTTPEGREKALEMFNRERENMIRQGFTKEELDQAEKMMKEAQDPREIFERHDFDKGPGGFDRDQERIMTREDMEKQFRDTMGREPSEQERDMMREAEERMREYGEREMMAREMGREPAERELEMMREYEREREIGDREREERIWEPPPQPQ